MRTLGKRLCVCERELEYLCVHDLHVVYPFVRARSLFFSTHTHFETHQTAFSTSDTTSCKIWGSRFLCPHRSVAKERREQGQREKQRKTKKTWKHI